jgi:hypothetical protein
MILRKIRRGDKRKRGVAGGNVAVLLRSHSGSSVSPQSSRDLHRGHGGRAEANLTKTTTKDYRGDAESAEKTWTEGVPGAASRDRPLQIQRQRQKQKSRRDVGATKVKDVRLKAAATSSKATTTPDSRCGFPCDCYFTESSYSFIQLRAFRTSRALEPSAGPTMPSFSIRSMRRAARP